MPESSRRRFLGGLALLPLPALLPRFALAPQAGRLAALPPPAQLPPLSLEISVPGFTAFEWPFIVVRDGPVGAQERVTLEFTVTETVARSVQAMIGGSTEVCETGLDAVVRSVEQGADIAAIGGGVQRPTYALAVRPGIASYADLRGKRIAVTDLRGGSTMVLRLMLQAQGLRDADYDMLPLGSTPNRYTALTNGTVDAALVSQPLDFRAQDSGYPLLDYTTAVDYQFNVYAIRRTWGQQNEEKALRFLRLMVVAQRWLHDPANRDQAIELGMRAFNADRSQMERTWDLYFQQLPGRVIGRDAEISQAGAETVLRVLAAEGEIPDATGRLGRYIDERYHQAVLRAL